MTNVLNLPQNFHVKKKKRLLFHVKNEALYDVRVNVSRLFKKKGFPNHIPFFSVIRMKIVGAQERGVCVGGAALQ